MGNSSLCPAPSRMAHVMRRIPADKLGVECRITPAEPVTLQFLLEDYLVHMKHHLGQIVQRLAE